MLKIIFNNKILNENKIKFSIYNRAFLYGDGLFESIKIINGKPFNLEAHLKRLFSASILFNLEISTSKKNLRNKITLLIKENKIEPLGVEGMAEGEWVLVYLGDIIISYDFINKPKSLNISQFKDKLAKIFIHGFLHLVGFDHIKVSEFKKMNKEELKIYNLVKKKF